MEGINNKWKFLQVTPERNNLIIALTNVHPVFTIIDRLLETNLRNASDNISYSNDQLKRELDNTDLDSIVQWVIHNKLTRYSNDYPSGSPTSKYRIFAEKDGRGGDYKIFFLANYDVPSDEIYFESGVFGECILDLEGENQDFEINLTEDDLGEEKPEYSSTGIFGAFSITKRSEGDILKTYKYTPLASYSIYPGNMVGLTLNLENIAEEFIYTDISNPFHNLLDELNSIEQSDI